MTPDDFRRMALALPEVVEGSHHGHADFRAHLRVFASLHPDGEQAMVMVPTAVQQELVRTLGAAAVPANGAWGRAGCTMLRLAAVREDVVREALLEAWQFSALRGCASRGPGQSKPKPKPAKPKPTPAKPRAKSALAKSKAEKSSATSAAAPRRRRRRRS